ncbi:MAG TPA: oxygenase MpaB family protein [Ktedonobacteraceae bacterium]|nr:oxygenase MpaB family protein [Ktedonobacteraceae bacterium]
MQKDSKSYSESVTWKIVSEAAITLGGSRAVLMQLAHPLVAIGVSKHSRYMSDPIGRTNDTFILGQKITFGSTKTMHEAARTINTLHKHVHGSLPMDAGAYESGTPYNARDPELLLWVHATLVDTILLLYPLLIGPLSPDEQEQYYQESKETAHLLGLVPKDMPTTVKDLQHYVKDMVYSNRLSATPQARQLAQQVLYPPVPAFLRPLMHYNTYVTCALLPPPIRDLYGLEWNSYQQRVVDLSLVGMRTVIPRLPSSLRVLPITKRLMEQGELKRDTA